MEVKLSFEARGSCEELNVLVRYLELLESQQIDKNVVVEALKSLESLCSKEIYNSLCYLLTIKQLSDHPDYA